MTRTGLDAAIDELYAGTPSGFVARRDELSREAKADGDKELAAAIKALRRPTVGAWYLNTAARAGLTSLRELLDLGTQLRETQAAGDFAALRDLAARRGPLVERVLRDLTAHLAKVEVSATSPGIDEARTTLGAALADPAVDEELRAGRLDRAHTYGGFGEVPMSVPEQRKPKADRKSSEQPPSRAELAAARREVKAAEKELSELEASRDDAIAGVETARARVEAAEAELAGAREAFEKAKATARRLTTEAEKLADVVDKARSALPAEE